MKKIASVEDAEKFLWNLPKDGVKRWFNYDDEHSMCIIKGRMGHESNSDSAIIAFLTKDRKKTDEVALIMPYHKKMDVESKRRMKIVTDWIYKFKDCVNKEIEVRQW